GGPAQLDRRTVELDRPRVGADHARQDLDQRRLAGAVLAEHGVDPAARTGKPGAVERPDAAVVLRDPLHPEQRRARVGGRPIGDGGHGRYWSSCDLLMISSAANPMLQSGNELPTKKLSDSAG